METSTKTVPENDLKPATAAPTHPPVIASEKDLHTTPSRRSDPRFRISLIIIGVVVLVMVGVFVWR